MSAKATQNDTGANRFELHTSFRSVDVADSQCINCGIGLTEAPDHDGVHKIRMLYRTNDGEDLCEACFFDSYDESGRQMVERAHDDGLETFYVARKHIDGKPDNYYNRYFFETHQAASGWAQANGGEYLGSRKVDPFKLQRV